MNAATIAQLQSLGEKIASELVFAEPGKDSGLLPVNSFLCQIEEALSQEEAPEPVRQGVRQARGRMDAILGTTGTFSKADLDRFGQWAAWWERDLGGGVEPARTAGAAGGGERGKRGRGGTARPRPGAARRRPAGTGSDAECGAGWRISGAVHQRIAGTLAKHRTGGAGAGRQSVGRETLNLIFRAFHTLKGGAGFLNLTAIHGLAHELESVAGPGASTKTGHHRTVIDLILAGADTLKQYVVEIGARWRAGTARADSDSDVGFAGPHSRLCGL